MTYWTMDDSDGLPEVTLCEHHALSATNEAVEMSGDDAFGSMVEAYAILSALGAFSGFNLGMTSSGVGVCGACMDEANAREAS